MAHHLAPRVRALGTHHFDRPAGWRPVGRGGFSFSPGAAGGLRRAGRVRWGLLLALPIALALTFSAGYWFAGGSLPQWYPYEAVAWFRIDQTPPRFLHGDAPVDHEEFDNFRRTQALMVTNPFVLNTALRDEQVGKQPSIVAEKNQVDFLAEHINVSFPEDAMMMRVAYRGNDPAEATAILNEVCDAFLKEVVTQERLAKDQRYQRLDDILRKNRAEIVDMREKVQMLAEATGSLTIESVRRKIEAYDRDLLTTHKEVIMQKRLVSDLEMQVGLSTSRLAQAKAEEPVITEQMVDEFLRENFEYQALQKQLMDVRMAYEAGRSSGRPQLEESSETPAEPNETDTSAESPPEAEASAVNRRLSVMESRLAQLQDEMSQLRAQARQELNAQTKNEQLNKARNELAAYNVELKLRKDNLRKNEDRLMVMRANVANLTKQSAELTQKQAELAQLEAVTDDIAKQVAQLKIELDAPDRVRVVDKASLVERSFWQRLTSR